MKLKVLGLAVASALAFSVQASDVPYSYAELSYESGEVSDIDGDDLDIDGLGFSGSYDFGNNVFAFGGLQSLEASISGFTGSADLDFSQVGVGYHYPISAAVDLVPTLSYIGADFGGIDDTGVAFGLGLRGMTSANLELFANVESSKLFDDSDTGYELGGVYYFDNGFGVGAAYQSQFDIDGFSLKARYKF